MRAIAVVSRLPSQSVLRSFRCLLWALCSHWRLTCSLVSVIVSTLRVFLGAGRLNWKNKTLGPCTGDAKVRLLLAAGLHEL